VIYITTSAFIFICQHFLRESCFFSNCRHRLSPLFSFPLSGNFTAYKKEIDLGENSFIRVNSIADPHPPKISKILIGASRCPQTCVSPSQMARTELERLRDRNQGIAPPKQRRPDRDHSRQGRSDLSAKRRPALETDRLPRSCRATGTAGWRRSKLDQAAWRTAFRARAGSGSGSWACLLKRDFVTHDALLRRALYAARWRRRHRR